MADTEAEPLDDEGPDLGETAPEADTGPEERLRKVKRWHKGAIGDVEEWRDEADTDEAYACGHQWTEADRKKLEEEQRVAITFNRVGPIVDTVSGLEINAREEISLKPREPSDTAACEAGTALIEHVRDGCDAEDEETDAFRDCVATGMGWLEGYVDADANEVRERRVDNREMVWPSECKTRNFEDARWLQRVRKIARDEAEALWPDADPNDLDANWARSAEHASTEDAAGSDPTYERGNSSGDDDSDQVTIVECQWREWVKKRQVVRYTLDPTTGQPNIIDQGEMEVERAEALAAMAAEAAQQPQDPTQPPPERVQLGQEVRREVIWQGFYGRKELEYRQLPVQREGFTWKAITGKWDREAGMYYGLIRMARDPQQYANKWLSQSLHILNTSAKNTVLYVPDSLVDPRKFEEKWAQPGATIAMQQRTPGDIEVIQAQGFPTGFFQLMQFAIESIRQTTGVNLELAGMQDNDQAGVLEMQRKQAAMTILAPFFGNLRRARKGIGRVLLTLILEYMPEQEMVRILGQEQAAAVQAMKAAGFSRYDVVVDEAPSSPNAKERAWQAIQAVLPLLQSMGAGVPNEVWVQIARFSPLPASMSEAIVQALEKPPSPEEQQKKAEAEQITKQGAMAKAERDMAAASLDRAEEAQTRVETALLPMKTQAAAIAAQRPRPVPGFGFNGRT